MGLIYFYPDCPVYSAEREGFKPPVPFSTAVFKTAAIDHSATFPKDFLSESGAKVQLYFIFAIPSPKKI